MGERERERERRSWGVSVDDINYQDSETAVERRPSSAKILKHQLAATFTMHSDYRADFLRFFE